MFYIGMIIIDSAPMLLSQSDLDNDIAKDNGQRASIAKPMGKVLKFMIPAIAKADNTLLIINHTRIAGKTFTGANIYTEPCGYALNFYPSVKVRFAARKFTKGDKLDISASQVDSETDGLCATFSVTKFSSFGSALNLTALITVFIMICIGSCDIDEIDVFRCGEFLITREHLCIGTVCSGKLLCLIPLPGCYAFDNDIFIAF